MRFVARVVVSSAALVIGGAVARGQSPVSGVFFNEGWESGSASGSFNSQYYGSASNPQFVVQNALTGAGVWALSHPLTAGLTPGSIRYATQHFGDSIAGPVLPAGIGQHFQDYFVQYKVYYSPGFSFHSNYKQLIIGTQDDRRHDEPCCNPWVAHYLTIYVGQGGPLLGEVNNKQAASGQWRGLPANTNGYSGSNPFIVRSGRWYTIEIRRRLNDAGVDNGIYQMWADGVLIADHRDVRFRVPFNGTYGANYTFGTNFAMISDYTLTNVTQNQTIYYDDVRFGTTSIGSGGVPAAPGPPTNLRIVR